MKKAFHQPPGRLKNAPTDYSVFISHDNEIFPCKQVKPGEIRFDLPFSDRFLTLQTAAEAYYYLGYSVIPLLGDTDFSRPKVPAIPWAEFQHRRASLEDQQKWLREDGFTGLGIVTGRISRLVVLDFDSEKIFNDFKLAYPDLLETHIVRSAGRQLPHLYFHLPDHLYIASQKGQGIDLLSDGRFVVAPPTTISGHAYKIIRGGMPRTLTERDIRRIQSFLDSNKIDLRPENRENKASVSITGEKTTSADLHRLYSHLTKRCGRNEALFSTSLYARDAGWTPQQAESCLVSLHSQQPTSASHPRETPAQRQREAYRTIRSAFSRPARPIKSKATFQQGYLSNSVREALLKKKRTYVIRTIEGLRHTGVQPEQWFTADEALKRLKQAGIKVGRDSVLKALKAAQGDHYFSAPPVSPPETANAVAIANPLKESKKMLFEGGKNQYKPQGGRPAHLYRMPTNQEMCDMLGVKVTSSDRLEPSDLSSAQKTRMGLHRELIKRSPRQYPLGWLAHRLGVSRRTIAAYHEQIPIHSRAMFTETPINWKTIERLPFDEPIQGAVLITLKGKKYPALRTIASRLLGKGERLCLKQQTANFYWYGEEPILARQQVQQEVIVRQERIEVFVAKQAREMPTIPYKLVPQPPVVKQGTGATKTSTRQNYRKPLKDKAQETLAKKVYEMLKQQISRVNARRLVITYSETEILKILERLCQRPQISNPTGFLVTILRSNMKTYE